VNVDVTAAADDLIGGHRGDPGLLRLCCRAPSDSPIFDSAVFRSSAATLGAAAPGASRAALCLEGTLARARRAGRGLHH